MKKTVLLIAAFVLLLTAVPFVSHPVRAAELDGDPSSRDGMTLVGDVNGDDAVSDVDAVQLLYFLFYPEDYQVDQACDYNGDGQVTDLDAVRLLFHTFFPASYPLHLFCDFTGDGAVTDGDAITLLYHVFYPDEYPVHLFCDFDGDGALTDKDAIHLLYFVFYPEEYPLYVPWPEEPGAGGGTTGPGRSESDIIPRN